MKSVAPPTEARTERDSNSALADQFLQDNDYLPLRGDQSWREQAALRIAGGYEPKDDGDAPDAIPEREDRSPPSEFGGRNGGGIVAALFIAAIIVPTVAVLTAPDILTAGFWGAHHAAPKAMAAPAPLRVSLAKAAPPPAPSQPMAVDRDLSQVPAASPPPKAGRVPKSRPALAVAPPDMVDAGNGYKFRTLVVGTDGSMKYEYFSSQPTTRMAQRQEAADDGKGFYAMVPDEAGTLQYKYFPSKPVR